MEKNFNLNEIQTYSTEVDNLAQNEYTLAFSSEEEEERTIVLRGTGKIKEVVSV